jgi:hypothetical protein
MHVVNVIHAVPAGKPHGCRTGMVVLFTTHHNPTGSNYHRIYLRKILIGYWNLENGHFMVEVFWLVADAGLVFIHKVRQI